MLSVPLVQRVSPPLPASQDTYNHRIRRVELAAPACDAVSGFYSDASSGYKYATMDRTSYSSRSFGCQRAYLNLPTGWELVPADSDGIRIGTGFPWGTHLVVFSNGDAYRTTLFGGASNKNRGGSNILRTSTLNGAPAYKPGNCHYTVLIRASLSC